MNRIRNTLLLLLAMNCFLWMSKLSVWTIWDNFPGICQVVAQIFLTLCILVCFIWTELLPCYEKGLNFRLQVLAGGYELMVSAIWAFVIELVYYVYVIGNYSMDWVHWMNLITVVLILMVHFMNGFWRTVFTGTQLGIGLRIGMLFFWWMPVVNLVLFHKWCTVVRRELIFEKDKYLLDVAREENQVCKTKYPVVMVHGIFFRDWQYFNYWGRVPKELKRNGANVYYGNQQSSLAVADSAAELKEEILEILQASGAEKVNIIAHSKGGLDARYAISMLGMADKVASLTTINTPHRGCEFADVLLERLPEKLIAFVAEKYNGLFCKLGDARPDFLAGVKDLTACACAVFNEEVRDCPQVYYQSAMSCMASVRSAGFPLNAGYLLSKKYEGANDGLVSVTSAQWGNYLGLVSTKKQGISHGDMIDLMRRNIKGFDVSEFYVKLFEDLKDKGF